MAESVDDSLKNLATNAHVNLPVVSSDTSSLLDDTYDENQTTSDSFNAKEQIKRVHFECVDLDGDNVDGDDEDDDDERNENIQKKKRLKKKKPKHVLIEDDSSSDEDGNFAGSKDMNPVYFI